MIITTAGRFPSKSLSRAKKLATTYKLPFIGRSGLSIEALKGKYQDDIVVVGKDQLFISTLHNNEKLFFHPNIAMVRAKRIFKGEVDPLIQVAKLQKGMSFLDCTLGLAADSTIASIAIGPNGSITGIEGNEMLYLLANEGLRSFVSRKGQVDLAMRRIKVNYSDHFSYLQQAPTNSFDVVYLDPMFDSAIATSEGINAIRAQAVSTQLTSDVIKEAKRVAKERVVLKDHWKSERFTYFGFTQHKRKTSLFHYGTIELKK